MEPEVEVIWVMPTGKTIKVRLKKHLADDMLYYATDTLGGIAEADPSQFPTRHPVRSMPDASGLVAEDQELPDGPAAVDLPGVNTPETQAQIEREAKAANDVLKEACLGRELVAILRLHCAETAHSEGAVDVLQRILRERDEYAGKHNQVLRNWHDSEGAGDPPDAALLPENRAGNSPVEEADQGGGS